jgi:F420-non-reducing hydrogenase iron-sulfur subunit
MANITVFCCSNSLYGDGDPRKMGKAAAGSAHKIELACSSRVETIHILKAIENGADGVLIIACPESECKLLEGSRRAGKRVEHARRLLAEAGLEPERVAIVRPEVPSALKFATIIKEAEAGFAKIGAAAVKPEPNGTAKKAKKAKK